MRVVCTSTPAGRIYRFYRTTSNLTLALKPLVPFLVASQVDVIVGGEAGDPELLLRVGPIAGEHEAALVELLGPRLRCDCVSS